MKALLITQISIQTKMSGVISYGIIVIIYIHYREHLIEPASCIGLPQLTKPTHLGRLIGCLLAAPAPFGPARDSRPWSCVLVRPASGFHHLKTPTTSGDGDSPPIFPIVSYVFSKGSSRNPSVPQLPLGLGHPSLRKPITFLAPNVWGFFFRFATTAWDAEEQICLQ